MHDNSTPSPKCTHSEMATSCLPLSGVGGDSRQALTTGGVSYGAESPVLLAGRTAVRVTKSAYRIRSFGPTILAYVLVSGLSSSTTRRAPPSRPHTSPARPPRGPRQPSWLPSSIALCVRSAVFTTPPSPTGLRGAPLTPPPRARALTAPPRSSPLLSP
jgi:hypothetical protein